MPEPHALPRRTRARLATVRRIDRIGAWLCAHHCTLAAEGLWRTCRLW